MEYFQKLGREIAAEWGRHSYTEDAFIDIAVRALQNEPPHAHVQPFEPAFWALSQNDLNLPRQADLAGQFGQPPVTVFCDEKFYISVLYWVDDETEIHQHIFSGAFAVLEGSAVHALFDFAPAERMNPRLELGALDFKAAELLTVGDVRPIISGRTQIHRVSHLGKPCVVVVIRTFGDYKTKGPQWSYLAPGLAVDLNFNTAALIRRLQALKLAREVDHRNFRAWAYEAVRSRGFYGAFRVLYWMTRELVEPELIRDLLEEIGRIHGQPAAALPEMVRDVRREMQLRQRAKAVSAADHRFLFALLHTVPDRRAILELVRAREPDSDPVDTIVGWIGDVACVDFNGKSPLGVRFNPGGLDALRTLLAGEANDTGFADLRNRAPLLQHLTLPASPN